MFTREKLCLLALVATIAPISANAAAIYDYTGNAYGSGGAPEFGANLTAVVDFGNAVGPNFTGYIDTYPGEPGSPISNFSLTSGSVTLTLADSAGTARGIFTFSNGVITDWNLSATDSNTSTQMQTAAPYDYAYNTATGDEGIVFGNPGTWSQVSVSTVPLPGTVGMFGTALVGLMSVVGARRKLTGSSAA